MGDNVKKFIPIIIFILIIFVFYFTKVSAIEDELPLLGRVIFVDPGHGGL